MATGRLPDPNSSPLTAKGDLYTYSTVPAKLAVGSDGETLVADSSATTGLRWQGNFAAGKNKIINGDMNIWQRGTSLTGSSDYVWGADRFRSYAYASSSTTVSRQSFTAGNEITGYEPTYFMRINSTNTGVFLEQVIEDVRTFAGQTATLSFWAKAASAHTLTVQILQFFGSGGSATVTTNLTSQSITTSWARYTATVSVPSVSGKTIGTSSGLYVRLTNTSTNNNFDIWGVQFESGSVATAFQTATGTLAGELAACQRYFQTYGGNSTRELMSTGMVFTATRGYLPTPFTGRMRTSPTVTFSSVTHFSMQEATQNWPGTSFTLENAGPTSAWLDFTASTAGMTGGRALIFYGNSTSARLELSAEL